MTDDARLGAEIAGYRVIEVIGRGGMGVVYLAEQASPRRKVALKVLPPDLATDASFRDRFARESDAAASIEHPNIVPIYQSGEQHGDLFIAMRYVEGTDLRSLLARERSLPAERAASIVAQVAAALDAAHEAGLVHRDVKPGNVLVGKGDHAYLTDFGLIKRRDRATSLTRTGQFMGTIDYVAPEQIRGDEVDGRTDVYSLGCLLYECLTGASPFAGDLEVTMLYAHLEEAPPRVTARRPELPAAIDEVVAKAMAKRPADRYPTAGALADAAWAALAPPPPSSAVPTPRQTRHWAVVLAGVAVAALVAAVVVLAAGSRHREPTSVTSPTLPSTDAGTTRGPERGVLAIDPTSGNALLTVPADLGDGAPRQQLLAAGEGGVWTTESGKLVYVDPATGTRQPIDLAHCQKCVHEIAVGQQSVWALASFTRALGYIFRVDPATKRTRATIQFPPDPEHGDPTGFVVAFGTVFVPYSTHAIVTADARTDKLGPTIDVPADAIAVGDGAVWVADQLNTTITRVDPRTLRPGKPISVSASSIDGIVASEGALWIIEKGSGVVAKIDEQTGKTLGSPVQVGADPTSIAAGFGAIWVADPSEDTLYRIDPATLVATPFNVGSPVTLVAPDTFTHRVWILAVPTSP